MAYTQQQLDDLDELIASGAVMVETPDGKKITLRALRELIATRNTMAQAMGTTAAAPSVGRGVYTRDR